MTTKVYSIIITAFLTVFSFTNESRAELKSLKILVVNGGCCHDYDKQGPILKEILEEKLNAEVTVASSPSKKTDARFEIYEKEDWAKGYDLVVHNECSANVTDKAYVKRILDAHISGVPAINLHCAMHSYRWGNFKQPVKQGADNAGWFEMIGVQSSGHGPKFPVKVDYIEKEHPVTKGLKNWTTPKGELYNNVQVFDNAKILAIGSQDLRNKKIADAAVVWTNSYGPNKTKIISISIAHTSGEMKDENFKELLKRSALWATGNINADGSAKNGLAK